MNSKIETIKKTATRLTMGPKLDGNADNKPWSTLEVITPEIAKALLEKGTGTNRNRSVTENLIERYTSEILKGNWITSNASIGISKDGFLVDGQHRLHAVVLSGRPIETFVVRGLDPMAFSVIDRGRVRSVGDLLHIKGYLNAVVLSTAARFICHMEGMLDIPKAPISFRKALFTSADTFALLDKYPSLPEIVTRAKNQHKRLCQLMGKGTMAGLFFLLQLKDPKLAEEYFNALDSGANIDKNSVIWQVREKLLDLIGNSNLRYDQAYKAAIVIKGWNLMRDGFHDVRLVLPERITVDVIK